MARERYYPTTVAGLGQAYGDCSRWLESRWEQWAWVVGFWRTCQDLRRDYPSIPPQLPPQVQDPGS